MNQLKPIESILQEEELTQLEAIKEELSDAWYKRQIFRTETEARYGVLNDLKFPTNGSKYWQCVREQMVHFDELTRLSFELRRKQIELREIQAKLAANNLTEYERDRLEVDKDECLFTIASGEQVAKDRVREIMQWSGFKQQFNDGTFDTTNPNTHQKESLFQQVLLRARVSPTDLSSEERLSIEGILNGLKGYESNIAYLKSLNGAAKLEEKNN